MNSKNPFTFTLPDFKEYQRYFLIGFAVLMAVLVLAGIAVMRRSLADVGPQVAQIKATVPHVPNQEGQKELTIRQVTVSSDITLKDLRRELREATIALTEQYSNLKATCGAQARDLNTLNLAVQKIADKLNEEAPQGKKKR